VVQETYLALRGKFPQYSAESRLQRFHRRTQMRDAGQEVSLHRGPLPQVMSLALAEHLLGKLTSASRAAMRAELKLRVPGGA
jgi:RNA polymerase sigma-70 factor (ECF subfamily)